MRLHLRKQAAESVRLSRETPSFPPTEWYEQQILDAASDDSAAKGLGAMTTIATDLLEQVRRADPAYGLVAREVSPGVFTHE